MDIKKMLRTPERFTDYDPGSPAVRAERKWDAREGEIIEHDVETCRNTTSCAFVCYPTTIYCGSFDSSFPFFKSLLPKCYHSRIPSPPRIFCNILYLPILSYHRQSLCQGHAGDGLARWHGTAAWGRKWKDARKLEKSGASCHILGPERKCAE